MEKFKKIAVEKLGFNELEALCYELLLIKGKLTTGEVCSYISLKEPSDYNKIKEILENFVERGLAQLVQKVGGSVDVYVGVGPFEGFIGHLTDFNSKMETQKISIQDALQKIKASTEKELKDVRTNVESVINTEKETIKGSAAKASENITIAIDKAKKEHEESLASTNQIIDTSINGMKEASGSIISTLKQENGAIIDSFKQDSKNKSNLAKDTIIQQFSGIEKSVEELFTQSKSIFSNTLNQAKNKSISENESQQDKTVQKLTTWKEALSKNIGTIVTNTGEKLDTNFQELKAKDNENTTKLESEIRAKSEKVKSSLDSGITTGRTSMETVLNTVKEQTATNLNSLQDALTSTLNTGKSALDESLELQKSQLNSYMAEKLTDLKSSFSTQLGGLESGLVEQKQDFGVTLDAQWSKFIEFGKNFFTETKQGFDDKIQSLLTFISEKFKEYEETTQIKFDSIKAEIEGKFTEYSNLISTAIDKLEQSSSSHLTEIQTEVGGKATELTTNLESQQQALMEALAANLSESLTVFTTTVNSNVSNLEAGVEAGLGESKQSLQNILNDSKTTLETQVTKLQSNFDQLATSYEEKVNADVTQAITDVNLKSDEVQEKMSEPFKEGAKLTTDHYQEFNNSVEEVAGNVTQKVGKASDQVASKIDTDLTHLQTDTQKAVSSTINSFISSVDKLKPGLDSEIKKIDDSFSKATDNIGTKSLDSIDTLSNNMLTSFDTSVKGVSDPIDFVMNEANNTKDTLTNVWEDVKSMELMKSEGTWQIVTQNSIMTYLEAMIKRTKLHFLIVVPDMKYIPVEAIMNTKTNQKVTIACPITDKALADRLISKDNIDLRRITEMFGNVFGADRDQEEAFYGPVTKDPNEMVCTITQQEDLIKIIAEMLGNFYRGRSSKYTAEKS